MRQFGSIGTYKADIAYPPIDLLKIAGYLRERGIASRVYDANTLKCTYADVRAVIEKERPRLVVFTTSTTALMSDLETARTAKQVSRDIITVTFGAHVKGDPVGTLELEPALDAGIYQDAEMCVRQIAETGFSLDRVGGIYRRQGERILRNDPHALVESLDEYGIAAHDMIDPSLYHDPLSRKSPLTITYSQTGCVNECSYCMSQLYKPLRTRTVPHFLKELRFIKKLGFQEVFFIDCGITNNHAWAREFLDGLIGENIGLSWWGLSRADRLTEDLLKRMKESGCHSVGVGVESANAQIIRNVNKKVDLAQVLKVVGWAHHLGMRVLLYFQFGLPGETLASMRESLHFAMRSNADLVTFGIATPVPGTRFYEYIKERDLFITRDWRRFDPALPPVFNYPDLKSEDIYAFSRKAYRSFYLRPSFILRRFVQQRSFKDLRNNWENFMGLLSRTSS